MKKILFVTNRNVLTTCGELRLIKNRAESLYSDFDIKTDFLVLGNSKRINSSQIETIQSGGSFDIIWQNISNFFSVAKAITKLKKKLKTSLKNNNYDAVVFSGSGMPSFSKIVKKVSKKTKIFVDIHGASEDILEVAKNGSIIKKLRNRIIYFLDRHGIKKSLNYINGFFVVTNALKIYLHDRFRIRNDVLFVVAPCATTEIDSEYFENYQTYRKTYRKKYNFDENTPVFVYSGGVSKWQCIEETKDLFDKIADTLPASKFLVLSHSIDAIKTTLKNSDNVIFDSCSPDELTETLCAGDFAFMLRKDCVTNRVAFPNKFLEYVKSKMKIIATPYVEEVSKQITDFDLGHIYDFSEEGLERVLLYVKEIKHNSDLSVENILMLNSFKKTLKSFVGALENGENCSK